jgi:hypothetical protein
MSKGNEKKGGKLWAMELDMLSYFWIDISYTDTFSSLEIFHETVCYAN